MIMLKYEDILQNVRYYTQGYPVWNGLLTIFHTKNSIEMTGLIELSFMVQSDSLTHFKLDTAEVIFENHFMNCGNIEKYLAECCSESDHNQFVLEFV